METDHGQQGYRFRAGTGKGTILVMSHAEYQQRQQAGNSARAKWLAGLVVVAVAVIAFLVFACLTMGLIPIYLAG